jgi:probable F420-dependent oxidoreductase
MAVEFGVVIPTWGKFGDPEAIRRLIVRAEELDYASAWVGDHLLLPEYATRYSPANWYEALTVCCVAMGATERIRFGTDVLVAPYRDPRLLAKMAATADRLSGGRLTLGMGVGFLRGEFEALGADHLQRGAVTDEYLEVMRRLWEEEGEVGYAGRHISFPPAHFLPKPLQRPLPLWIGGNGRRGIERAARLGDGWHPLFPAPTAYAAGRARIEALRGESRMPGFTFSYSCPETRLIDSAAALPATTGYAGTEQLPDDYAYAPAPPTNEEGRPLFMGTAAEVSHDIASLVDAGAEHFVLRFWAGDPSRTIEDSLDQMERFAIEVRPHFDTHSRRERPALPIPAFQD